MLRIRPLITTTGLAVALAALAPTSRAQAPGGPGGMPGMATPGLLGMGGGQSSPIMVVMAPSVQKELKLTDAQKAKVFNLSRTAGQKNRDLFQTMVVNGRNTNPQAVLAAGMQLRQEADQALSQILDAKQKERLGQIVLQAEGPLAVARPEIANKLRLNEAQNEHIQMVMMQVRRELFLSVRQAAANGQYNPAQARALATQLRQNAVQEISKVIDRKQKSTFNKMLGEPFDTTKIEAETSAAAADPNAAAPAADPAKPAGPSQAKEAPDAGNEKEGSARDAAPPARKKGRSRSGSNR